jgi:16S rRNA processing protein RimM
MSENLLLMGRLGRAHGVRGDVRVFPVTDDPSRFESLEHVYIGAAPAEARRYRVDGVRYQYPKGQVVVLLALDGVDDRDESDALKNLYVYADEAELPALEEGEVFVHDLVGLTVEDEAGASLGHVRDILEGVGQDILVVARDGRPDVLVPDVPDIVIHVDVAAGRLVVRAPEGLFDGGDG